MLILEGPQGHGKSMALRVLFGEEYFSDQLDNLGSKDAAMQAQGIWCIEMAELTTLSRAESNIIKEWITRVVDRFRPPYGRNLISAPRRCVLAGTVNPEGGYLKDATGGRRFWPLLCEGEIDVLGLIRSRDQIWAEAYAAWKGGEKWWMTEEQVLTARIEQDSRYEGDPWDSAVAHYLRGLWQTSIATIMKECLGLPAFQQNRSAQMRISKILVAMAWTRQRKHNDDGSREWIYVKYQEEEKS